jgi:hypothetical protein
MRSRSIQRQFFIWLFVEERKISCFCFFVSPTHVQAGELKATVFKSKAEKKLYFHVREMSDVWIKK